MKNSTDLKRWFFMWVVIIVAAFALSFVTGSKEPTIYLGHAEYTSGSIRTCVVRMINATKQQDAKALFDKFFDSILLRENGTLIAGSYIVWRPDSSGILKKQQ